MRAPTGLYKTNNKRGKGGGGRGEEEEEERDLDRGAVIRARPNSTPPPTTRLVPKMTPKTPINITEKG